MSNQVEESLRVLHQQMEAAPGLFDGYREVGEDGAIGPQQRLQEMFLKRLYGASVDLSVTYTEEFGNVSFGAGPQIDSFDLQTMKEQGMTTTIPFTSDKGSSGVAKLDWQHQTFTFAPNNGEATVYVANEFVEYAMTWGVGHALRIGILCVIAPSLESDADRSHEFLSDVSLNKFHIENLIFADRSRLGKDGRFNPQAGVTFKDISDVTGVSPSTLSNIRNGKKSLENLTWTTLAALSFYAKIRMLDMHIIDMLRHQLTGDTPLVGRPPAEPLASDVDFEIGRIVITLRDGTTYQVDGNRYKPTDERFNALRADYEDDQMSMTLMGVLNESGELLRSIMLPKLDVKSIELVDGGSSATA